MIIRVVAVADAVAILFLTIRWPTLPPPLSLHLPLLYLLWVMSLSLSVSFYPSLSVFLSIYPFLFSFFEFYFIFFTSMPTLWWDDFRSRWALSDSSNLGTAPLFKENNPTNPTTPPFLLFNFYISLQWNPFFMNQTSFIENIKTTKKPSLRRKKGKKNDLLWFAAYFIH